MRPQDLAALLRPRIGLLAAAGAGTGWLVAGAQARGMSLALCGALLLSCGVSALNQLQERDVDGRMARTRDRPLPAGRLRPGPALALALALLAAAALALALSPGGLVAALLVPLTTLCYNGLYTPLKRRTSLAMLVGGLAGALPPVVGFAAAGGSPLDARALLLAGVFYAWQVPHFWLFALVHREQYEAAGLRVPQHGLAAYAGDAAPAALRLWLVSYGALMLLLPAFGLIHSPPLQWLVAALAACTALCPGLASGARPRRGFALVNASLALLLALLAADSLRLAA